ncbi:YceD family protein [Sphingomonas sp. GCM10030256]|uniref:YceD family protein n=1 Tax=Sphingomonas sp. GCM10030256 TaxID=3273427 RepID=UPI0036078A20
MSAFSDRLSLDRVRDGERLDLSADDAERAAIAARLGLPSLERLEAHVALAREDGQRVRACGRIKGVLEQSCVATGEPVPAHVDEPFEILFMPEPKTEPDEEIELSEEDCDVVFHDGASIDLGSALADTLALSLDPYPRSPQAEEALRDAGVLSEDQAGPFAALAKLKGLGGEP